MAQSCIHLKEVLLSVQTFLNSVKNLKTSANINFSFTLSHQDEGTSSEEVEKAFYQLLDRLSVLKPKKDDSSLDGAQIKTETLSEEEEEDITCKTNPDLVQIQVDRDEIDRRISSFVSRKRKEVNEWNAKEFCNNHIIDEESPLIEEVSSCARVDAIFVSQPGFKNRIKVSRVENTWGPQTRNGENRIEIKKELQEDSGMVDSKPFEDIEERLKNMESHLKIRNESSFKRSIYSRLKVLEDRILFLEGLSPDYFCPRNDLSDDPYIKVTREKEKALRNCSVTELQQRMLQLKESLRNRMKAREAVNATGGTN